MLQNLETALAGGLGQMILSHIGTGGLGQMSLVKWLPDVSAQSRVFISGNEVQGMVHSHLTCPPPPTGI